MKNPLSLIFFLAVLCNSLYGQSISGTLHSSYEESSSETNAIQWTVGQILTDEFVSEDFSVTPAWIQGGSPIVTSVASSRLHTESAVTVFPNPFVIAFSVESEDVTTASFKLFDPSGRELEITRAYSGKTRVTFGTGPLPQGLYILQVKDHKKTQYIKLICE